MHSARRIFAHNTIDNSIYTYPTLFSLRLSSCPSTSSINWSSYLNSKLTHCTQYTRAYRTKISNPPLTLLDLIVSRPEFIPIHEMKGIKAANDITSSLCVSHICMENQCTIRYLDRPGSTALHPGYFQSEDTVYISQLASDEHVFLYKDDYCNDIDDIINPPGRTVAPSEIIGSFDVKISGWRRRLDWSRPGRSGREGGRQVGSR